MKIKSITKQTFKGIVHNIGVKNDESYCVNHIKVKNCRGVWVPIYTYEEQPKINKIPKTVMDNFDLIDGRPVINSFKQIKKPLNKSSEEAQKIIKNKLKT